MKTKIFAIVMLLSGCGTLFNEDNTEVTLSAPEGVTLTVDGMPTPAGKTLLSNKRSHVVTATNADGTLRGSCTIDTTVRGHYIVGDIFLGLVPVIVDAVTGGWYDLDKTSCSF